MTALFLFLIAAHVIARLLLNKIYQPLEISIWLNVNPLNANPTKRSNTLKQFVGKLPTNCLSMLDHFVGLALKGLMQCYLMILSQILLLQFLTDKWWIWTSIKYNLITKNQIRLIWMPYTSINSKKFFLPWQFFLQFFLQFNLHFSLCKMPSNHLKSEYRILWQVCTN